MKMTLNNNRRLHSLLTETGKMEVKADLCHHYSGGRTSSSKEITDGEALQIITHLQASKVPNAVPKATKVPVKEDDAANKMRRKIIYYAHKMLWELPDGKADMKRIDSWCEKFGQFHKALNKHNEAELAKLVTQFENLYKTFLTSVSNGRKK